MGFALLPLAAILFFVSIMAMEQTHTKHSVPSAIVLQAQWEGQTFVAYRNAVSAYMQNNPSFMGEIPAAALNAPFSEGFLRVAGNIVVATASGQGRVITSYAAVHPGALRTIQILTQYDSSINMAANGQVVSVIQMGV